MNKKTILVNKSNIENKINHHKTGLKTNVCNPNYFLATHKGSKTLKLFLRQLEDNLLIEALNLKSTKKNQQLKDVEDVTSKINVSTQILAVTTDKTNSFSDDKQKCLSCCVIVHRLKSLEKIECSQIAEIYETSHKLLAKHVRLLMKNEYYLIQAVIEIIDIPTPKLLIKDHKKPNPKTSRFPTRFSVRKNHLLQFLQE